MSEYKRLLAKKDGKFYFNGREVHPQYGCHDMSPNDNLKLYNHFAKLEDEIENGTLVRLPCKVGDKVYYVNYEFDNSKAVKERSKYYITSHTIKEKDILFIAFQIFNQVAWTTREQAEAKLLELKGEK